MNKNPLEKVIEQKVCDHAKKLGCLVYKFTSPSRRSVPDRLFILPEGRGCFFVEFKRGGQKPTKAQEIEIAKIRAQGATVFIIDNVDGGKVCITNMVNTTLVMSKLQSASAEHLFKVTMSNCEKPRNWDIEYEEENGMSDPAFN